MLYFTGDTHGTEDIRKLNSRRFPEGRHLTRRDHLVICGDWGFLWEAEPDKTEEWWLRWFDETKPWTTLVVDGNHENHWRLAALPTVQRFGADVGQIAENVYHLRRGRVYTIEGKKVFVFGGALSIDKADRILGVSYWPEELPSQREFYGAWDALEAHNFEVDYVVTHAAPLETLRLVKFDELSKFDDPTSQALQRLWDEVSFEHWFCGHYHVDADVGPMHFLYQRVVSAADFS